MMLQKKNLSRWLSTLMSTTNAKNRNRGMEARARRKMLLESLERREVFDAGWASAMQGAVVSDMDGLIDLSYEIQSGTLDPQQLDELIRQAERDHDVVPAPSLKSFVGPLASAAAMVSGGDAGTMVMAAASAAFTVPVFNSLSGAAASLYLDFDGHFEATWGDVTTPPLDRDGDPTSLGAEELSFIEDVWRVVAEDYAPFNINVTTVEPSVLAAGVPDAQANGVAMRLAIGGTEAVLGYTGGGLAGMARINSFSGVGNNVAFVFPESSTSGYRSARTVGVVASHEAGHAFGLRHLSHAYNLAEKWQGIMNSIIVPHEDAFWMTGTNDQGNFQDDMAMLAGSLNGFGYRADDHANTVASATPLVNNGTAFVGSGVIALNSDVDVWSLSSSVSKSLKVTVNGSVTGQNLDTVLDLLDASGNVLKSVSPNNSNDAEFYIESGGTQTIRVRSTGEYGRVGQYTITTAVSSPGVTISAPNVLLTSEQGSTAEFSMTLNSRPSADVVVVLNSNNSLEGTASLGQLVFTPSNWFLPQNVTVTGINDAAMDGPKGYSIGFRTSSADPSYESILLASLSAINADDDMPGWAKQIMSSGKTSSITTNDMQVDDDGTIFLAGSFNGTVDFDPSSTVNSLTAIDLSTPFVAKYSQGGELIWVKQFDAGDSLTYINAMALDGLGNIYMTGYTYSTNLTFGSTTLTNNGSTDAYVAKLDSSGSVVWAKGFGGTGADTVRDLTVDSSGNLVLVGDFTGAVDFDPSAAVVTRTSAGNTDIFITQLTNAGNFLSAATYGGVNLDIARQVEFDSSGNKYVSGYFATTTQLGGQTLISAGPHDGFLLKVNNAGTVQWVRQAVSATLSGASTSLAVSATGNVLWSSAFTGDVNFGAGSPTLNSGAAYGVFLTQWDNLGNLVQSASLASSQTVSLTGVAWDPQGQAVLLGRMLAETDFDPTGGVVTRQPLGLASEYVLRLNSALQFLDVTQIPSNTTSGGPRRLAVDASGNILVAGDIYASKVMPTGQVLVNSDSSPDLYLLHLTLAPGLTLGSAAALQTSESGQSASFTVVLDTPPTSDVTVALTSNDPTEGTVSPASLIFNSSNWNVPRIVTVTGVNDSLIDGDITYSIGLSLSSSDTLYNGLLVSPVSIMNRDDDQPLLLFSDSFEVSQWNGLWVEDSQNDWDRLNQRATSGTYSAEVDGSAKNATLTTAASLDLSGMQSATLTFSWLIESGFDAGEYLSMDISTNGGSTWTQDIRRLNGNVSPENSWSQETVDLTPYRSSNVKIRFRSSVSAADEDANVDNVRITGIPLGPNSLPVAQAGGPYTLNEGGSIALNGGGSVDPDGTIVAYAWDFDNDGQYDDATGVSPTYTSTVSGSRTIKIQVTDNRGGIANASANLTVNNVAPTANAGPDKQGNVGQTISLSAAASTDPGNDIVSYAWDLDNNGQFINATGVTTSLSGLAAGTYTIGVRVTDTEGASSTDFAIVTVTALPVQTILFQDSFEISEWNGLWVEDVQNDWQLSTQRATQGIRSAEVDGSATNATLSMAQSVNLSGYASRELTFDWLIESGFDAGEYLVLDISTNGGSTWTQNVRRLDGNVSTENVWRNEVVDLTDYATTSFKIRFRSSVSDSTEDANVDNVKIVVTSSSLASALAPAIVATNNDSTNKPESIRANSRLSLDRLFPLATGQIDLGTPSMAVSADAQTSIRSVPEESVDWLHASDQFAMLDEIVEDLWSTRNHRTHV